MMKCLRCGKCCYYLPYIGIAYNPETPKTPKKCKYLQVQGDKTFCRIYKNRLGVEIDKGVFCVLRTSSMRKFEGCSYNHK